MTLVPLLPFLLTSLNLSLLVPLVYVISGSARTATGGFGGGQLSTCVVMEGTTSGTLTVDPESNPFGGGRIVSFESSITGEEMLFLLFFLGFEGDFEGVEAFESVLSDDLDGLDSSLFGIFRLKDRKSKNKNIHTFLVQAKHE